MLKLVQAYQRVGLVPLIVIGLLLGILVGCLTNPTIIGGLPLSVAKFVAIFGQLFVGALKAVAPLLVFILVNKNYSKKNQCFIWRFIFIKSLYINICLI